MRASIFRGLNSSSVACQLFTYSILIIVLLATQASVVRARGTNPKTKLILRSIRMHQKAIEMEKKCEGPGLKTSCEKFAEEKPVGKVDGKATIRSFHRPVVEMSSKRETESVQPEGRWSHGKKFQKKETEEKPGRNLYEKKIMTPDRREWIGKKSEVKKVFSSEKIPKKAFTEQEKKTSFAEIKKRGFKPVEGKRKTREIAELPSKFHKSDFSNEKKKQRSEKKEKIDLPHGNGSKSDERQKLGNFIFLDADPTGEISEICEKHAKVYLKQLKKYRMWALMMFDATAKLPSGILFGNTNQFGDFDECLSINATFKKQSPAEPAYILGKYCLASIDVRTSSEDGSVYEAVRRAKSLSFLTSSINDPSHFIPRFSLFNWGLCVPAACSARDVELYIGAHLRSFDVPEELTWHVKVSEEDCIVRNDRKPEYYGAAMVVTFFYFTIVVISIYATYVDVRSEKRKQSAMSSIEEELAEASQDITEVKKMVATVQEVPNSFADKAKKVVMAFSLKKNAEKLLSTGVEGSIECANGIKSLFTIMLYLAHKTIPLGWTPFGNRIALTKVSNNVSTVLLRASIIYTDSFLLISGLLTSFNLSKELSVKGKISWTKKILARFIRLTPALFAVLLFYAYLWDHTGSGPLWNMLVKKNSRLCQEHMWRNLLYIQNFFRFENMCAPQTHQLALDMQMSAVAPLLVHLLHKYDKLGLGILQALFLLSSIVRYVSTSTYGLSVIIYHGIPVSQLYKTADLLYTQTLHRANPYIMGTVIGHYLAKAKPRFEIPKAAAAVGWCVALALGSYSLLSPAKMALRDYEYDVTDSAHYAILSSVSWSVALGWVIVACHLGSGGILNQILCNKFFLLFSRISYSVYLTQFLVFFYVVGVKRIPESFSVLGSVNVIEFAVVTMVSIIVTLLFDLPMTDIKKIILDSNSSKTSFASEGSKEEKISEEKRVQEVEIDSDEYSPEDNEFEDNIDEYEKEIDEIDEEDEERDMLSDEDKYKGDESDDSDEEKYKMQPLRRAVTMHFKDGDDDVMLWLKDG